MPRRFSVGELVVMQHASYHDEYNGEPAIVVGGLAPRRALNLVSMTCETVICYDVRVLAEPDLTLFAMPHQLRPLRGEPEPDAVEEETAAGREA